MTGPGPAFSPDGVVFTLWAPRHEWVTLEIETRGHEESHSMSKGDSGYFRVTVPGIGDGARYRFSTSSGKYPDPASRSQPDGVHGASELIDFENLTWTDQGFVPPALHETVLYELHVGTFTPEGTFSSAAERLADLAELGVTSVEVMPISEFPGSRNWGYDGTYPYAAKSTYGGPRGFCEFIDRAHAHGISVILDLVMNHFGPEGNYTGIYGNYTTARHTTPWGDAINFDGPGSDEVRRFFLSCIDHWMGNCHVDGFRLDAIHEIHDESAIPFLRQVSRAVHRQRGNSQSRLVFAESGTNDRRVVLSSDAGGLGMDTVWADDFHHCVHTILTGEREGYYADFGSPADLAKAIRIGWTNTGGFSPAHDRSHGSDPSGLPSSAFLWCTQNHDQVGNRMLGERLRTIAGPEAARAALTLLLLSPYVPLLFMGQEFGAESPFLYFVDHGDPDLLKSTREGRATEFAAFRSQGNPPDPGAAETFTRSQLEWPQLRKSTDWQHTRRLLAWRTRYDCFHPSPPDAIGVGRSAVAVGTAIAAHYAGSRDQALLLVNLAKGEVTTDAPTVVGPLGIDLSTAAELYSTVEDNWLADIAAGRDVTIEPFGVRIAIIAGQGDTP